MTSPEKKIFTRKLLSHDDRISEKVNKALMSASQVQLKTNQTIEKSMQMIRTHDNDVKSHKDSLNNLIKL